MKFPKSLNIKGQKYKIKLSKLNSALMGVCDKQAKEIHISNSINNLEDYFITYAHELCHAYMHELNLDAVIPYDLEELICLMSESLAKDCAEYVIANKKAFEKWAG